jgi:signal transduction histidine kinase/iron only hydrogenase large subunit-like protein
MCYTCVRECPAKAIRIAEGQAEVVPERCIGCGNCVRVCSQHAKSMYDTTWAVRELLAGDAPVAAIVAPSFPAEFDECTPPEFVGMVRALGFDLVSEVSFGADLVADRYHRLVAEDDGRRYIATSCPAIVAFVARYHPDSVPALAPIASPMVAAARVLKRRHGEGLRIVFVGPCIAKKGEAVSEHLNSEVDTALTFKELRRLLTDAQITPSGTVPTEFDPPRGGTGGLFALSRGLLQAGNIGEDLVDGLVVATDGRSQFVDALQEFESGHLEARLLEVLACSGCIDGPGIGNEESLFCRRNNVSRYVRERIDQLDWDRWHADMAEFADLDLSRGYSPDDQRVPSPSEDELKEILQRFGKFTLDDELNCGACGYETCREHAVAIYKGLAENEMCLPNTIVQLRQTMGDLATSHSELAETREALLHSERLASMGQLAAGIAHELNNPLGVVLMYSHLLKDEKGEDEKLQEDLSMITEQADRCKKIVAGLLHFARQNKVELTSVDVRDLVDRALKGNVAPAGVTVEVTHAIERDEAMLDRDQMVQVLTNLIGNAYAAMANGGTLSINTSNTEGQLKIRVSDTGTGMSKSILDKVFEPFFTTKEVGMGTGLGLAVTYGIVKMHSGDISVASNDDPAAGPTGTTFTVSLPT